ncbi:MAG: GNAT family N-acetyltransferase [Chloroflexi bacterium]|nr:GNAT family N-acetyltransferase [Chloroflexota bacterium]
MAHYLIRPAQATLADAALLLQVEQVSLGDSDYSPEEALAALRRPEHRAYLALVGDEAAGFCSCLRIVDGSTPCLEIDMLGVAPEHRGHGLGAALIRTAVAAAQEEGISRWRALVAVGNRASLRAFERAGLRVEGPARALHVYTIQGLSPVPYLPTGWHTEDRETPLTGFTPQATHTLRDDAERLVARAETLQVHTLAYRGLWVEALWADAPPSLRILLRHLVERAKALSLDEVGYFASGEGMGFSAEDLAFAGFPAVGTYYRLREALG